MKTISFLTILLVIIGCEKGAVKDREMHIYRTNNNYSNKIVVELSDDKSTILNVVLPETQDKWPMSLIENYWLNGTYGMNETAYLSLTKTKYNENPLAYTKDSLLKLIIDKDPFIEYYLRNDNGLFYNGNGVDTFKLNNIIRNDEIEKYFIRIK